MDILVPVSRCLLYLSLMWVFGLPAFGIWLGRDPGTARASFDCWSRRWMLGLGSLAVVATLAGCWCMAGNMVGNLAPAAVYPVVMTLLGRTAVGCAVLARLGLLLAWLGLSLCTGVPPIARRWGQLVLGGAALGSLAWGGHGAMDNGLRGGLHLSVDIVHLLAAGVWLGALVMLFRLACTAVATSSSTDTRLLAQAATGFGPLGTWTVLILCLSGLVNDLLILGPHLSEQWRTLYARLLLLKLSLLVLMLTLAASHRFRQLPRLQRCWQTHQAWPGLRLLRASLGLETMLAVLILALVGWLGSLDPAA